jgi:DeoR/GlpR family transcriptional regulator of sugar metabolism
VTETGVLSDADPLEAEVKRAMIAQSGEAVLLVDRSKLSVRGLAVVAPAAGVTEVVADGFGEQELAALRAAGASVRATGDPGPASLSASP